MVKKNTAKKKVEEASNKIEEKSNLKDKNEKEVNPKLDEDGDVDYDNW